MWKGSIFARDGRLLMAVKKNGKWKQHPTPYRVGQEELAKALLKRTRELLQAGQDAGLDAGGNVSEYALGKWLEARKGTVESWPDDFSRLKTHILPAIGALPLGDVRPRHIVALIAQVRDGEAAPRTVRNVYAVVRALFRDAMIAGLTDVQPCILTHHHLGRIRDAKSEWRATALFSVGELAALTGDRRVPEDRRVLYGLLGFGCLRHGEAAALRWRHIEAAKPLNRLMVANSNRRSSTKTGVERVMPIHRALARMLAEWKLTGWPLAFGRSPEADDLVVPHTKPTNKGPRVKHGGMRSDHDSYKRLRKDCVALGIRTRRVHDLRRSGVTFYREAGADTDKLKRCTHGGKGDVLEQYTSFRWASLCEEVLCASFVRRRASQSEK